MPLSNVPEGPISTGALRIKLLLTQEESRRNDAAIILHQTLQASGESEQEHAYGHCLSRQLHRKMKNGI